MKLSKIYQIIHVPALLIVLMWFSKLAEYYFDIDFSGFGIFPRNSEGLKGIIFSPFVHGSFKHLMSNTIPFFLLSSAIFYFYRTKAYRIILFSWILTGFEVWLGARPSWHIGASGLVYAFFSFLFFSGILSKERRMIALSLLIVFLYGGLIWGIFPGEKEISWESHLFGFLNGFIFAYFFGKEYLYSEYTPKVKIPEDFSEYSSSVDIEIEYWYNEED